MSVLEIVAAAVSFAAIWLTMRRSLWCWPLDLLSCALYYEVFRDVRLYADMILQLLFGLSTLYGWIAWRRGADAMGAVPVQRLGAREAVVSLAVGALGAVVIGGAMARYTDAALPWMDATLSSFSLVAQVWTARRYPANWLLWIAVDVVYVGMFVFKGLWLTAGLYAAMTALAVAGYIGWRRAGGAAAVMPPLAPR